MSKNGFHKPMLISEEALCNPDRSPANKKYSAQHRIDIHQDIILMSIRVPEGLAETVHIEWKHKIVMVDIVE